MKIKNSQSEENSLERENLYYSLIQKLPNMLIVLDEKGRITYESQSFIRTMGYPKGYFIGRNAFHFVHPEDLDAALKDFATALGQSFDGIPTPVRFRKSDGTWLNLEVLGANLIDHPEVRGIIITIRDVSERLMTEDALRESEERYRLLLQSSRDVIFTIAPDLTVLAISSSVEEVIGYSPDEIISSKISDLPIIHSDHRFQADDSLRRLLSGEKSGPTEYKVIAKDGCLKTVDMVGTPLIRENKVIGFTCIARDITERKNIEEKLRRSEERNKILSSLSFEGICIHKGGIILDANDTYVALNGYDRLSEILGRNVLEMVVPDSKEKILTSIREGFEGTYEIEHIKKDGRAFPAELNVKNIVHNGTQARVVSIRDITERKSAEEMLRNSEEKYRRVFENTGTAMVAIEENANISLVNAQFEKLSGYSREEIEGKMIFTKFVAKADCERMLAYHHKRRSGDSKVPTEYEFSLVNRNGEQRDMILKVAMIPDTKQTVASMLDISELKKAQQGFLDALQLSRTVLATSPVSIKTYDESGQCIAVNDAAATFTGGAIEELLTQNFRQLESWRVSGMLEAAEKALATGQTQALETSLVSTFGKARWVDSRFAPFYHNGKLHLLALMMDITERKQAEAALITAEREKVAIMDAMSELVVLVDKDLKVVWSNKAMNAQFGMQPDQIKGGHCYEVLHKLKRPCRICPAIKAIESGKPCIIEDFSSLGKRWKLRSYPIKDENGDFQGVVEIVTDITYRKNAEDELAAHRERLQDMIKERTRELEEKTFDLEELNTALKVLLRHREEDRRDLEERFIANIKNLILPYAEKMKRTHLDQHQKSYLNIIETHLNEISSPLMKNMQQFNFTPTEVKIASLIKDGKTTKEISEVLGIASSSINSHRNSIRKKLDLSDRGANLQSRLQSLG